MTTTTLGPFTATFMEIVPAQAEQWLNTRQWQRSLDRALVLTYSRDIAEGMWKPDGNTIKFDSDGNLIDGQHRLEACVQADKPIVSLVVWGVSHSYEDPASINFEKPMSIAWLIPDVTSIQAAQIASAAGWVYSHQHNHLPNYATNSGWGSKTYKKPSKKRLHKFIVERPELTQTVLDLWKYKKLFNRVADFAFLAAMYYIVAPSAKQTFLLFLDELSGKCRDFEESGPGLLQTRLITARRQHGNKMSKQLELFYLISFWNSYVEGERPRRLPSTKNGTLLKTAAFPHILCEKNHV